MSTVCITPHNCTASSHCRILTNPDSVAEAAVVGINDELTGQAVNAFVALKDGTESSDQVKKDLILQVRKSIGPFAAPKAIFVVPDLPKTRSGKIMRRIMRKILAGEEDQLGDITTVSFFPDMFEFFCLLPIFLLLPSLLMFEMFSSKARGWC